MGSLLYVCMAKQKSASGRSTTTSPVGDGNETKLLISEHEAAKTLGVCLRTMFTLRHVEKLPYIKVGTRVLYSPDALRAWINTRLSSTRK